MAVAAQLCRGQAISSDVKYLGFLQLLLFLLFLFLSPTTLTATSNDPSQDVLQDPSVGKALSLKQLAECCCHLSP